MFMSVNLIGGVYTQSNHLVFLLNPDLTTALIFYLFSQFISYMEEETTRYTAKKVHFIDKGKYCFETVHVLELSHLVWCTVKISKSMSIPRFAFNSFVIGRIDLT